MGISNLTLNNDKRSIYIGLSDRVGTLIFVKRGTFLRFLGISAIKRKNYLVSFFNNT